MGIQVQISHEGGSAMKMLAYRLIQQGSTSIVDLAAEIDAIPLASRFFLGANEPRLERHHLGSRFLRMNFGRRRRGHGPGQMGDNSEVSIIDLPTGREFGEDTAAVFDRRTGYLALQYNHFGPRFGAIEEYLTAADRELHAHEEPYGFRLIPHYTQSLYDRIRRLEVIKEVDLTVSLPRYRDSGRQAGAALGAFLANPYPNGTETLKVSVRAGRGRDDSLSPGDVIALVQDAVGMRGSGIRAGRIYGREGADDKVEPINLLEDQVSLTASLPPGLGQRVDIEDRWHALEEAIRTWLTNQDLPYDG